ncbi:MAG: GFA family protein [Sedimenticola sp.]
MTGKCLSGSCLCGSVRFEVEKPLREVVSCYCSECRRSSGNFVSATGVPEERLHLLDSTGLAWYESDLARRGFCQQCGSNLFWTPQPADGAVRIMAGCLEPVTGLKVRAHIFTGDKCDFQEIAGTAPEYSGGDHGIPIPS